MTHHYLLTDDIELLHRHEGAIRENIHLNVDFKGALLDQYENLEMCQSFGVNICTLLHPSHLTGFFYPPKTLPKL